ncbi:hypothetical protein MTP99_012537 [Tenebrio molitor]|jgi:hypothetical protein|uniref:Secreted protein n=1 Tax=Tenebrio molitor TaxID=7067 RepID=A0A8J6HCC7_TENMO|nr:hypothetical protein GEV33_010994 [Tenebrio molitor]KAJ3631408.1 hypothetical protein MTP99_012537 [Tenebrio molitor]CAH1371051.1 unnamed protein product [Tenebrio molitor]
MYNSTVILDVILIVCLCQSCFCAPYQQSLGSRNKIQQRVKSNEIKRFANRETKKDIFISRGWGAGGMPFSVLYMNPTFSSSKAPATVETNFRPQTASKSQRKSLPQVRTSMRQKSLNRSPHSVIPQLFVSYGWGPLGKK